MDPIADPAASQPQDPPVAQQPAEGEQQGAASATAQQPATQQQPPANDDSQDRNWRQLRGDRDYWRDRATQLEQQHRAPRQPEQGTEQPPARKTLADFEFDDGKYSDYLREEARREAREATRAELSQAEERRAAQRRESQFAERQTAFAKDTADYHQVVSNPAFVQSEAVLAEIMESEQGPALAYYLASNIAEANRLNAMSPIDVARAVARLEAKLVGEREKAKAAKNQIPVGQQPAPTPKLDGSSEGSGASVKPDTAESDALSDAEWARRRNAQIKARSARK